MPITLDGTGSITGLTTTGISAVQQLPAGSVLQVVNATYSTQGSVTGTTAVASGLSATITPKFSTSKILVMVSQQGMYSTVVVNSFAVQFIFRNSTPIAQFDNIVGYVVGSNGGGSCSTTFLDSPATTSATTYTTQIRCNSVGGVIFWNNASGSVSTITLMEIAG